jgi:anti-sigma B factor antagonist
MQIEEKVLGDVTVVKINGDITLNAGGDVLLKDKIQSLLQQGQNKLVLDLGNVSYVDSAGLGQLVQIHATTKNKGGALRLANVTKRLKDLLVVTKLVTIFDSYNSESEAVGSFKKTD